MDKPEQPSGVTKSTRVLTFTPSSFTGHGPAQSCANIVTNFSTSLNAEVYAPRFRAKLQNPVTMHSSLPAVLRHVPWRAIEGLGLRSLDSEFRAALDTADPSSAIAYFWPNTPIELVQYARNRGILTVREMINSARATAGPILAEAYARLSLPNNPISVESIDEERRELLCYDYIFASNPMVENSLLALGISPQRILPTTFGWDPTIFAGKPIRKSTGAKDRPIALCAAGTLSVRKGIPELLEAWQAADLDAELVLAGRIDSDIAKIVNRFTRRNSRIRAIGYIEQPARIFHSADLFISPTLEEGGPQVTFEAGGCGLPIITTPMGTSRMVKNGYNGIVVDPGSTVDLTEAIKLLIERADLRAELGANSRRSAAEFTYDKVGLQRSKLLANALAQFRADGPQGNRN